jgi:6-phosphogluconolactonase
VTQPAADEMCGASEASGEPEIVVLRDAHAVGRAAAEWIAAAAAAAVERRGRADIASTGGSTPMGIYTALAAPPIATRVPWDGLHVWLGDDRFVPRSDAHSNMRTIDHGLLGADGRAAPLPAENAHPWPVEASIRATGGPLAGPLACAAAHEAEMRAALPADALGRPVFDLVLIGVGGDAHVMSLFPGSPALDAPGWTAGVAAPTHIEPHVARVTCTAAVLCGTPALLVVVTGASKAAMIARVLRSDRDVHAMPAQLARRDGATWILDDESASALP